jgi:hypothetical protein
MGDRAQRFPRQGQLQARSDLPPSNAEIAELLSRESSKASYVLQRAYRRAARSAFLWELEARDLVAEKRPLTELAHVGPFLQKQIRQWDPAKTASAASTTTAQRISDSRRKSHPAYAG